MSLRPDNKLLLLLFALKAEAKPIIRKLEFRALNKYSKPYYESDKIGLIITGVGSSKSSSDLLEIVESINPRAICNIGVCGSTNKKWLIGSTFYVNKVIDAENGAVFYPDLLVNNIYPEAILHSFTDPQLEPITEFSEGGFLVDMEGATIFKTLKDSFPPQYIQFLKVVSDYLNDKYMTSKYIEMLIDEALDGVVSFIEHYIEIIENDNFIPNSILKSISHLSDALRLTSSQRIKLERIVNNRYLNGDYNPFNNDITNNLKCNSKKERNILFERICNEYLQ